MEQDENCLYVWDTELTIMAGRYCGCHTKTEHKERLTDGKRHMVRIVQPAKKVVKQNG